MWMMLLKYSMFQLMFKVFQLKYPQVMFPYFYIKARFYVKIVYRLNPSLNSFLVFFGFWMCNFMTEICANTIAWNISWLSLPINGRAKLFPDNKVFVTHQQCINSNRVIINPFQQKWCSLTIGFHGLIDSWIS